MELISIGGLNCYEKCVITIAQQLGLVFALSFSTLWSETDFTYEEKFNLYSSKRIPANLKALGLKIDISSCDSPEQAAKLLDSAKNGAFVIIGMDAFYLPWSPVYHMAHFLHYFFIQKDETQLFTCFDPAYGKSNVRLPRSEIISHAFELRPAEQITETSLQSDARKDAETILQAHPQTRAKILTEMDDGYNPILLGKYIETFINNRYLYRHYLGMTPLTRDMQQLFHDDYFMEWKAIKNGLYKSSLLKKKEKIITEVKARFSCLIDKELEMAKQMTELPHL